jgi:hypothetical protein
MSRNSPAICVSLAAPVAVAERVAAKGHEGAGRRAGHAAIVPVVLLTELRIGAFGFGGVVGTMAIVARRPGSPEYELSWWRCSTSGPLVVEGDLLVAVPSLQPIVALLGWSPRSPNSDLFPVFPARPMRDLRLSAGVSGGSRAAHSASTELPEPYVAVLGRRVAGPWARGPAGHHTNRLTQKSLRVSSSKRRPSNGTPFRTANAVVFGCTIPVRDMHSEMARRTCLLSKFAKSYPRRGHSRAGSPRPDPVSRRSGCLAAHLRRSARVC